MTVICGWTFDSGRQGCILGRKRVSKEGGVAEAAETSPEERRTRYLARVRAEGRRLLTADEILAAPRDDPDPPSDEELDAFLEVIYEARDRDRDRNRA
jgi:hypothetical protein